MSPDDYTDPGMVTLIYTEGSELPAEECVTIATTGDLNLEGKHDFSLNVFDTSLGTNSLVTISSDSSTTIITINDDDGEIEYWKGIWKFKDVFNWALSFSSIFLGNCLIDCDIKLFNLVHLFENTTF